MKEIVLDCSKVYKYIDTRMLNYIEPFVESAHEMLHKKTAQGSDFLGWVDLPISYDRQELDTIKKTANLIRESCNSLIVIGIGGSYTGARAAIEMLGHSFYNNVDKTKRNSPDIYFLGNNLSSTYVAELLEVLESKSVCAVVISKSGTTMEPAIAFKVFREYMERRYGTEESKNRIFVVTDKEKGVLKSIATQKGYTTFNIPDDIGGRYSVLTPVGLLPIAVSGADIDAILDGAKDGYDLYNNPKLEDNDCYTYAAIRNILYKQGKVMELMATYEPKLEYFGHWWKQLYSESEGKDGKGIFASIVNYTTDLHSVGQYIQDGLRNMFETVIDVELPQKSIYITKDDADTDHLNFISGKDIHYINRKAMEGTILAHTNGGVPNLIIKVPTISEYYFGKMVYFFQKACGMSGYLLGINPFDQPGVQAYKKEMLELLKK